MNDTFRKVYTELSEEQKLQMKQIKDQASVLLSYFNECVPTGERSERSRCMAIARTNLETAIMYAVKSVTTKGGE